jgi:hypothetical protein
MLGVTKNHAFLLQVRKPASSQARYPDISSAVLAACACAFPASGSASFHPFPQRAATLAAVVTDIRTNPA